MNKWREEGGLNPIALRDTENLNNALRNKTIIALASDHFASDIQVEYFGRKTTAVSGPVLLGLKYKVPLVLAYSVFEGNKIKFIFSTNQPAIFIVGQLVSVYIIIYTIFLIFFLRFFISYFFYYI